MSEQLNGTPGEFQRIPLSKLRKNDTMLRDVDRENEDYLLLRDSVRSKGVIEPIVVTPNDNEPGTFIIINGLQRFSCSEDCGLPDIPCRIHTAKDLDILESMIVLNASKVDTKHAEYAKALKMMIQRNPLLTMDELAKRINQTVEWLKARLNLLKLGANLCKLVDDGTIGLTNAITLSNMPEPIRADYVERAKTMPSTEFTPLCQRGRNEYQTAIREGKSKEKIGFIPMPKLRKLAEIQEEINNLGALRALINNGKVATPDEIAKLTLNWVIQMDPLSQQAQKEAYDVHQAEIKLNRAKAAQEKAKTSEAEANEALQSLQSV